MLSFLFVIPKRILLLLLLSCILIVSIDDSDVSFIISINFIFSSKTCNLKYKLSVVTINKIPKQEELYLPWISNKDFLGLLI